jgi:lactoylglutathione lyase
MVESRFTHIHSHLQEEIMFCSLGYVVLFAHDFDGTLAFYSGKLGMPVRFQDKGYAELAVEGSKLALMDSSRITEQVGPGHAVRPASGAHEGHITLMLEDEDHLYQELKAKGVAFLSAPQERPWGQRTVYLTDPEGHLIELATNLSRPARTRS